MTGELPATLTAPAKVTRTLRVTGVRDDGYHLLDAEMVSVDLADTLHLTRGAGLTVVGPFANGVPTDGQNLVVRALEQAGCAGQVAVTLDKQIPAGGGLGGGSTDAGAILAWAGQRDRAAAAALGADVPFCVVGGRARVRGIGEQVDPLPFVAAELTLVIPPLTCSTVEVYRAWDRLGGPTGGVNDLEPAALVVEPHLAWWRDEIRRRTGIAPVLAGSGSTWYVPGRRDDALAGMTDEGAAVIAVRTVPGRLLD